MAHDHANSTILTHRTVTIVSFVLSVYFSIMSVGGVNGLDKNHSLHVRNTPFTANVIFIFVYWVVLAVLQLMFMLQYYSEDVQIVNQVSAVTWHFTLFNLLQALWAYLFATRDAYVFAEIVVILNFFNVLALYVRHKPYAISPLSTWMTVHLPTAALPFSWLMFALFWNGAVAVHARKSLVARILANIFIWDFLLVPVLFLLLYKDWGVGMSTAFLTWGLGVGQFFIKVFALQWIFAFIIAAIVTLLSFVVAVPSLSPGFIERVRDEERASGRLPASGETAPLLSGA